MPGFVVIQVKVIPRARTSGVVEVRPDGALKIKVTAAPERGKANQEVCSVVAAHFHVPERNVEIISGHTSQLKRVKVTS